MKGGRGIIVVGGVKGNCCCWFIFVFRLLLLSSILLLFLVCSFILQSLFFLFNPSLYADAFAHLLLLLFNFFSSQDNNPVPFQSLTITEFCLRERKEEEKR